MYHFFVKEDQLFENKIMIYDSDAHHIKDVLRIKPGEEISVTVEGKGGSEYRCALSGYTQDGAELNILFVKESDVELPCRITIYQGLPKADKMETVIQKSVELGAARIVPVNCERSIVKLDDKKASKKQERWQAIALSAAKQSQRGIIPEVGPVVGMKAALSEAKGCDKIFVPYEKAENMDATRKLLGNVRPGESIAVFIGPEGGFSEGEIESFTEVGGMPITLGKRILRTETAAMVFMSFLTYVLEP